MEAGERGMEDEEVRGHTELARPTFEVNRSKCESPGRNGVSPDKRKRTDGRGVTFVNGLACAANKKDMGEDMVGGG